MLIIELRQSDTMFINRFAVAIRIPKLERDDMRRFQAYA